jgi:nicotinamide-nucleotide amidase
MRVALINTGTELLLGDVQDRHLAFIAREIFPLGLRIAEQRTVPDGNAIRDALVDLLPDAEIVFMTGGLGPTTDDITREMVAEVYGVSLEHNDEIMRTITERLRKRGIPITDRISRQAMVPRGARVLPNNNGTAPGFYLSKPHLFVLPGPPRELQPMFRESVLSILREIVPPSQFEKRTYRIAMMGESLVEKAIGDQIKDVELGYCARPGEVDVRIIGEAKAIARADEIIRREIGLSIFSTQDETLAEVVVKLLQKRGETVAVAESCTGGYLANRLTNVAGASKVFVAGYITYANEAKIDILHVAPESIEKHGAVSEEVARAMAEGARHRARSTYALATTGIAGPGGGSEEKRVGTVYIALASPNETHVKKMFYPSDRETFKDLVAQAAFDLLRRKIQ